MFLRRVSALFVIVGLSPTYAYKEGRGDVSELYFLLACLCYLFRVFTRSSIVRAVFLDDFFSFLLYLASRRRVACLSIGYLGPFVVAKLFVVATTSRGYQAIRYLSSFGYHVQIDSFKVVVVCGTFFLYRVFSSIYGDYGFASTLASTIRKCSVMMDRYGYNRGVLGVIFSGGLRVFYLGCFSFFFSILRSSFVSVRVGSLVRFASTKRVCRS